MNDLTITSTLHELTEGQLASDPRIAMRKLAFEFHLQQEYFGTAAMMVAEFIGTIQRLEAAESSGNLSVPSVKAAAILWQNEVRSFKYWFGSEDDDAIGRLMKELAVDGIQKFVANLAVELQVSHE